MVNLSKELIIVFENVLDRYDIEDRRKKRIVEDLEKNTYNLITDLMGV